MTKMGELPVPVSKMHAPKRQNVRGFLLPLVTVFFLGFFFLSSMKIKVTYKTNSGACRSSDGECNTLYSQTVFSIPQDDEQIFLSPNTNNNLNKPKRVKPTSYPYTIVTGSSANHLCSLEHFLYSLNELRTEVEEFPRIVVYNLGMNRTQLPILDQLVDNGLIDDLETFDYFKYPRFWDIAINAGEYAWKTGILNEARVKYANDSNGILVWLDSGNILTPEFLRHVPNTIRKNDGFWSPSSSKTIGVWTHPGMLDYYNVKGEDYNHFSNCNGAVFGVDAGNQTIVDTMIVPWFNCGLDKNCIAPPGSSRKNHRQDQAALTLLAYMNGHRCKGRPDQYDLQIHRDGSCRTELLALDIQGKLSHPSTLDSPKWYPSNTMELYRHPEWRYPEDKVPEQLLEMMTPPIV